MIHIEDAHPIIELREETTFVKNVEFSGFSFQILDGDLNLLQVISWGFYRHSDS